MLEIIKQLFCLHHWEEIDRQRYVDADFGTPYTEFYYVCKKCGARKRKCVQGDWRIKGDIKK